MPHYQAALLDQSGHACEPTYHIVCDSDDEAIVRARRLIGRHSFEVRSAQRLVLRVEGRRA
jgi:hypothetical protein